MEKKHFGELSNLLTGIKGETIGKPGDQGSVYPPWEGLPSAARNDTYQSQCTYTTSVNKNGPLFLGRPRHKHILWLSKD